MIQRRVYLDAEVLALASKNALLVNQILFLEKWRDNLDKKLQGPAINFLPGNRTVDETRELRKSIDRLRFNLACDLERLACEIAP